MNSMPALESENKRSTLASEWLKQKEAICFEFGTFAKIDIEDRTDYHGQVR